MRNTQLFLTMGALEWKTEVAQAALGLVPALRRWFHLSNNPSKQDCAPLQNSSSSRMAQGRLEAEANA